MLYYLIIPFAIGVLGVVQNTWNRQISEFLGIPIALMVNNFVLLACSLLLLALLKLMPPNFFPSMFYEKEGWVSTLGWKNLLPGICGFLIIGSAPIAIQKAGALKVFLGVVVAQLLMSLFWDHFVEAIPATTTRVLGAVIAMLGAFLATR